MIIDFHTHIFPPSFPSLREELSKRDATFGSLYSNPRSRMATADELVAAMDEAGVDVAVVMGIGWTDRETAYEANNYIIEATNRFPRRLVGFCSVNPTWGSAAVREVERCAGEGMKGVGELHPDTQGYDLTSKEAMALLMDATRELGLIVLTHSSEPVGHLYPGKGKTTPEKLYSFVLNFPENPIVCAHWGGGLPFYSLMPEVAQATTNVYYDTAASPLLYSPEILSTVVAIDGPDRVLFGTDFPLIKHDRHVKEIWGSSVSKGAQEQILGNNAQALLGLSGG